MTELAAQVKDWEDLLPLTDADPVFLDPHFVTAWWRARGGHRRRLRAITVREHGRLVGIAPFMVTKYPGGLKGLGLIGEGEADYGGIVFPPDRPDVLLAILRGLVDSGDWHWLRLRHIPEFSSLRSVVAEIGAQAGLVVQERYLTDCPYVNLPGSYADFLSALPKSTRGDMRRQQRRLTELGQLEFRVFSTREREQWLPTLFEQHIQRWAAIGKPSIFSNPEIRNCYLNLTTDSTHTGKVHFSGLFLDDRPIALHFGFVSPERFYYYKPTFDHHMANFSPGKVLTGFLVEQAIAEGRRVFDFLRGTEEYKQMWTSNSSRNFEQILYRNTLLSRLINTAVTKLRR